jgi:23S rRNA pseudouridine1911/1915/1917 synthase
MEIPIEDDGDAIDDADDLEVLAPITAADYSPAGNASRRLEVPLALGGRRLDVALAELLPEHSRSRLQAWIREGRVNVDGRVVEEVKGKLHGGEAIVVEPGVTPGQSVFAPEPVALAVIYEDASIAVIDKPAGLVVHPGSGNWSGTLLNGLLHRYPEAAQLPRAGIVHRLDKDTSGLMVVARTLTAQTDLVRQLQARTVNRHYLAVAIGHPTRSSGTVDAPIGRHPRERTKMAIVESGKAARTHYCVIERFAQATLLECQLDTGRTHQIRVHMTSLKLPLIGDQLYRGRTPYQGPSLPRQALHARQLGLLHPATGEAMEWQAPLPDDMQRLLAELREDLLAEKKA